MCIVRFNRKSRIWALLHDVAWTEDRKLQGTLFGSQSNRRSAALCKGIARDVHVWEFFERCADKTDEKEFNGTPDNVVRYNEYDVVPYVFDNEADIIVEGFSLVESASPHYNQ